MSPDLLDEGEFSIGAGFLVASFKSRTMIESLWGTLDWLMTRLFKFIFRFCSLIWPIFLSNSLLLFSKLNSLLWRSLSKFLPTCLFYPSRPNIIILFTTWLKFVENLADYTLTLGTSRVVGISLLMVSSCGLGYVSFKSASSSREFDLMFSFVLWSCFISKVIGRPFTRGTGGWQEKSNKKNPCLSMSFEVLRVVRSNPLPRGEPFLLS